MMFKVGDLVKIPPLGPARADAEKTKLAIITEVIGDYSDEAEVQYYNVMVVGDKHPSSVLSWEVEKV